MVLALAVGIYANMPRNVAQAVNPSITVNSVHLVLQIDADANNYADIGDQIRITANINNTDAGSLTCPSTTTATVDLSAYGGVIAAPMSCITADGAGNLIFSADFVIANAGISGIQVPANNPASAVVVTLSDTDETVTPGSNNLGDGVIDTTATNGVDTVSPAVGAISVTDPTKFYSGTPNYVNTNITIQASATDANGVSGCEYTMNGGVSWAAASYAGGNCSKTINAGINTGSSYTFNLRATDNAGNVGSGTALTATGDITNPTLTLDNPADTATTGTAIDFKYTPTDIGSGLAQCQLYWNYPAGGAITGADIHVNPTDSVQDTFSKAGLTTEGTYTWDVACTDNVGSSGWGNWPAHRTFQLMLHRLQ